VKGDFRAGRLAALCVAGAALALLAVAFSCAVGTQELSWDAALAGVPRDSQILFGLRLPRALLGLVVGAALATGGASLQALLRNPLADPFVLGISGGAALGGTVVLTLGNLLGQLVSVTLPSWGVASPVTLGGFAGAVGTTLLVFTLGRSGGRLVPQQALLVGVVFNAIAYAAITLLRVFTTPEQGARLVYWLIGYVGYEPGPAIAVGAVAVAVAVGVLVALSGRMNLLALGDDDAAALGVNVGLTRGVIFFAASLATGAAVALSGMVGFVGLLVPHVLRLALGPDHRMLVPLSALGGAAFLVVADAAARLAFLPLGKELPVGALTALLGGPAFLWLLRREGARS
jgi:iron complex transport system permease protein